MLVRFHVAEEVTRSPFGVQARQNLDSSRRLLILRELHDALMAVPTTQILLEHVRSPRAWVEAACSCVPFRKQPELFRDRAVGGNRT